VVSISDERRASKQVYSQEQNPAVEGQQPTVVVPLLRRIEEVGKPWSVGLVCNDATAHCVFKEVGGRGEGWIRSSELRNGFLYKKPDIRTSISEDRSIRVSP